MVEYKYNAWGTQLSRTGELANTLGYANPFRYRGYIYDDETWMYWLRSRYYYPELHRFISADIIDATYVYSSSLYAYCFNSPLRYTDPDGFFITFGIGIEIALPYIPTLPHVPALPHIPGETLLPPATFQGTLELFRTPEARLVDDLINSDSTPQTAAKEVDGEKERSDDPPAKRYRFNTRKEAYERAKRAGGGKEPDFHNDSRGPHYHPNVPKNHNKNNLPHRANMHDHYYFPMRSVILFEYRGIRYDPSIYPYF